MFYLLDTNILIHIIRGKRKFFFDNYDLDNPSNQVIYSIFEKILRGCLKLHSPQNIRKKSNLIHIIYFALFL
jgi:predicted nucleic acid-binding protein